MPADGRRPMLLLDMATSLVAEGKVLVASNGGKPVPEGALVGPDGSSPPIRTRSTARWCRTARATRPTARARLRAFGMHKGSGLAFMCEILAGVLTGGDTSGPMPGGKRARISNGMLSIYLDPAHFGARGFRRPRRMTYAAYVKASRPTTPGGEVLVPGEPEARTRAGGWPTGFRCSWTPGTVCAASRTSSG